MNMRAFPGCQCRGPHRIAIIMTILPVQLRVTLLPKRFCQTLFAAGLLASAPSLVADVTLPHVFSDNMVL